MRVAIRILVLATLSCALITGRAYSQGSTEAQAAQLAQALVKQHEAWRSKLSTPGASIQAKESGRENGIVRYRLYVSGLPDNKLYTVLNWPVNQKEFSAAIEGVSLGKDGLVSCTGRLPGECSDPDSSPADHGTVDFVFRPAKGEPFRIALVNGDSRAAIVIVPEPIAARDKGCNLEAVRLTPGFELAYLTGSGFSPNAEVSFDAESYGEKHPIKTTADSKGEIHLAIMPFVTGHSGGTTRITGTGMACAPSFTFEWGQL